jgi:pimeloyl-ACP methyl ester carboxylesterase
MNRMRCIAGLLLFAVVSTGCTPVSGELRLERCQAGGADAGALCGTWAVPEDPDTPGGHSIELNIVVLPARTRDKSMDPIFFLHGGPGAAATALAPLFARSALRQRRDIVLMDQRGTGGSNPLNCPMKDLETLLHTITNFDLRDTAGCRESLPADLQHYTTSQMVADLDAVRQALGAEQINLIGGSYGTRAALEYIRRHGDRVRTATLRGVAPPSYVLPAGFDAYSMKALHGVLEDCQADSACRQAFPDVGRELDAVLARLAVEPGRARIRDPFGDGGMEVTVDRPLFVACLHYALYTSAMAAKVPAFIHTAHEGYFDDLMETSVDFAGVLAGQLSLGAFFSVACAEDAPFYDAATIVQGAQDTLLRGHFSATMAHACEEWNVPAVPEAFKQPVRSDVPVLLLSGEHDPVTPPEIAAEAGRHLPNAVHLVLPETGHSNLTPGCTRRILEEFIEQGSMSGVDTECVAGIRRPRFDLSALR